MPRRPGYATLKERKLSEKTYDMDTLLVLFKNASLAPQLHKHKWQVAYENSANPGDDLFAYLLGDDGVWLSFSDRLADFEVQALTGYAISELEKRELTSSGVRVWGLRGDKPLLPIPFTLVQVLAFDEHTCSTLSERHQYVDDTELHIQELHECSPDAAEVVRALVLREMPNVDDGARTIEPDYEVLATRDQLLDAFKQWGLQLDWFDDLGGHKWLLDARRIKGRGQRSHQIKAMFCPYAVMLGMTQRVREKIEVETGWRILKRKFPKTYAIFEAHDPR